jgi:hypothetical protein
VEESYCPGTVESLDSTVNKAVWVTKVHHRVTCVHQCVCISRKPP